MKWRAFWVECRRPRYSYLGMTGITMLAALIWRALDHV